MLTMLIIAFGIFALVGILTSIDAVIGKLGNDLASMGANTFTIRNRGMNMSGGRHGRQRKRFESIRYEQAVAFSREFEYPSVTSVSANATFIATVKNGEEKTKPNVTVLGVDENYLITSGFNLSSGRNFTPQEVQGGMHTVIIGKDIVDQLFPNGGDPVDALVSIGNSRFKVIGVLEEKGNSFGMAMDNQCLITLPTLRQYYSRPGMSFTINVMAMRSTEMDATMNEAIGTFRRIRKIPPGEENTFELTRSDSLSTFLVEQSSALTVGAAVIAFFTLLASAIGLMNIMLVSVTERTQEIGTRKALGANSMTIRRQFLYESVLVGQLGGLLGILLGILGGMGVAALVEAEFSVPWKWMLLSVSLCLIVGVISGYYPAKKAASLDPIDALRYE